MSLFCVITLLCFSYAEDWGEVDNVISFGDSSNRVNWEYGLINLYGVDFDSFYFNSECCSSYNMVFEDQYSLNGFGRYLQFALNETIFVHSFFIRISSNSTFLFIDCDKLAAETNLYIGCFNNELICRNSLIDNLRTHITTNSNMLTIFGENDQKILLNFNQYFNVERPFIYIGGLIQQTVSVNITSELPDSEDLNELYVFTGNIRIDGYFNSNINNISMEFIIEEVDTYKIEAVCTRNGISRYLFYTKDSISSENCDCYAVGSNYYYSSIELLNDCNIYSSNIPAIINKANVYLFNETITIKELIVTSNYRQLIVNSSVNSVNLSTVTVNEESNYLSIGIITTEGSSNTLTITSLPSSNYPSSIIFLLQKERPIEFVQEIECDNQAIIINPTETTCNDFNLFNHYCYYSHEDIYYQSNLEKIDYSCPCNKNQSNCTIELDKTSHTTFTQLYPVTNFIINQESTITPLNNFNIHLTSDVTVTLSTVTNNIISVSNNSVNFCLNLTSSSDGYLLLVSNVLGLSQQTRNIKSSTLQYTISNDYYCKSLYIENGEDTCIICDSSFNTNGYCSNSLDVMKVMLQIVMNVHQIV
ncbi:hypothetical protein QTN25_004490 [Entamoeba marina]